ncbi:MAG: HAMP domain-containing sensor histidine kinase [Candidatus Nealsonbacteria bacterium]
MNNFKEKTIRTVPTSPRQNLDSSFRSEIGKPEYINGNCWLVKNLSYAPYRRCQYCEFKFRNCLFLHYQTISLVLIAALFTVSFLIEGEVSTLIIISAFTLVIVYGYFFNKSTEKIIEAVFAQKKAKEALEELTKGLESKVEQRTKELKNAYGKLKKLDETKSEFISIASHQLRTPLTAVKGYLSMMIEGAYGKLFPRLKKPLQNVYESNEKLINLVNDLLDLTKLEAGKIAFSPVLVSLEKIVSEIISELKINADKNGLYLKLMKPEKALPQIMADQSKIRQIILNIIDNAIKYTTDGGVTIRLEKTETLERIIISDTGVGITEDEMKNLFQMFSRAASGSKLYTNGAGVGLHVAKKFVEMHEGRIRVESEGKDKGSTFYIELPLRRGSGQAIK